MENTNNEQYVQGDLFSGFESPAIQINKSTIKKAPKATTQVNNNPVANIEKNDKFEINKDTRIKYDGQMIPVVEYFTEEELLEEAVFQNITADDFRARMESQQHPEMEKESCDLLYLKNSNLIIPTFYTKKKGLSNDPMIYLDLRKIRECDGNNFNIASSDGKILNIRSNEIYSVCTIAKSIPHAKEVKPGVLFKLPKKIDWILLQKFVEVARLFATLPEPLEVLAEIYWSSTKGEYYLHFPEQYVSKMSVDPIPDDWNISLEWIKVLEIHSHHFWKAKPSAQDDESENGICIYAIVGKVHELFPDITARVYTLKGTFMDVDPTTIFEHPIPVTSNVEMFPQIKLENLRDQ